ncbi:type II toxin-antitoxin system RelE/ParE family toxin [Parvularcula sp. IMCC14364]|uniref:type II toxin-antitoxin system RelE/ParE family toxin n=1 Tax=Parvularcula sp. IMCC14364 TaxID=3067902 RepID=UPI002740F444|nr:type II toxin-antitoxin system RelE/ParE family toxin [Parvularcula sp. IMCC14364]
MSGSKQNRLIFTAEAFEDLDRLDKFLRNVNPFAADSSNAAILDAMNKLLEPDPKGTE